MKTLPNAQKEVYKAICSLMKLHGFHKDKNGDLVRPMTGCRFYYSNLISYKSVLDFQLDWPYGV
jgi:hypothetical protein